MAVEELPDGQGDDWIEAGYEEVNDDGEFYTKEQCEEFWEGYRDPDNDAEEGSTGT